jgi:hypothetical protein
MVPIYANVRFAGLQPTVDTDTRVIAVVGEAVSASSRPEPIGVVLAVAVGT